MEKRAIESLIIFATILSSCSVIYDIHKQECSDSINQNWYVAFQKSMLSLDANIDDDEDQYEEFLSEGDELLKLIEQQIGERNSYAMKAYTLHMLSLVASIIALLGLFRMGK